MTKYNLLSNKCFIHILINNFLMKINANYPSKIDFSSYWDCEDTPHITAVLRD